MNQLTLSECSKRKLDETYLVVYAIKNEINIKKGDYIENYIKKLVAQNRTTNWMLKKFTH